MSLAGFPATKAGNRSSGHMNDVCCSAETEETELRDVDIPEQLTKWERLWKIRKIRRRNINGESGIPEHIREIIKKNTKS